MEILATAVLVGLLLLISVQDIRTMRISNALNLMLAIAGVIWWLSREPDVLPVQLGSAFLAAILLWTVRLIHSRLTGRMGLGLGDVKLIGAGMIWINPHLFPLLLFTASAVGLVGALSISSSGTGSLRSKRIPFGPYLAFGILVCWLLEMVR